MVPHFDVLPSVMEDCILGGFVVGDEGISDQSRLGHQASAKAKFLAHRGLQRRYTLYSHDYSETTFYF
jgi:hypothetical protein